MANWDNAPWMIPGGVIHSTEVARLLAYGAFGGREGILGGKDLQVRAQAVVAASVRIAPGACSILNKDTGASYDAYAARLPIQDTVAIAGTSGSARTDLVIARVENPFPDGSPYVEPSAGAIAAGTAPFVFTRVIAGVAGVTPGQHPTAAQIKSVLAGMSAIPLASIAIPASTATIAQSLIKDWRKVAINANEQIVDVVTPGTTVLNDATWRDIASITVDIPEWATHFSGSAIIGGASFPAGNSNGNTRVVLDGIVGKDTPFNETGSNADRTVLMTGDKAVPLPEANRDKTATFKVQGQKVSGTVSMTVNSTCTARLELVLHCKPESN